MDRMARHGDGSIVRRKDGRIQVSITLTSGRRIYRTIPRLSDSARQEVLAERTRRELVAMREAELDPGGQTIGAFLTSWLDSMANARQARLRPNTLAFYRIMAKEHVIPVLGDVRLEDLRERQVQAWLDGLALSPQYISHCRAFLRRVLNVALRQRMISRNPAQAVELPPIPKYRAKSLSAEEARHLIKATIDDRLGALWRLAIVTGLREGELLGLAWDDIDLEAGKVHVRWQLARQNGTWVRAETKAARDLEEVSIDAGTVASLATHRTRQAAERTPSWGYWGMVFVTPLGNPFHRRELAKAFGRACDAAGITHRRFHDIRHSNATLLRDLGVSLEARKARLGHNSDTMAARYARPSMNEDRAAVELLAELLA